MLYKKLDKDSIDSFPIGLDIFRVPMTQVAIEKTFEREFLTLNPISTTPYNFKILTASSFLDPRSVRINSSWSLEVMGKDETTWRAATAADKVGVVNGVGAVWKNNVNVKASAQVVSDSNRLYAYRADKDMALMFSEDAKKSSMNAMGYYYDPAGKSNQLTSNSYIERSKMFFAADKKDPAPIVQYSAPVYADIFQQDNYILSMMELDVQIYPQKEEFLILADDKFAGKARLVMHDLRMMATFVDLHPGVALEIEKRLEKEDAKYPVRRHLYVNDFFPEGRTEVHQSLFSSYIPRTLYYVLVRNAAFNGDIYLDPFHYHHAYTRFVQITGGNMTVPNVQWDLDFEKNKYIQAFDHFHRTVGSSISHTDCGINRDAYADGYTIFVFNLTPSLEENDGFDFVREGPTIIHTRFSQPVQAGGYATIYIATYDHMIYINQFRSVSTDLTA